MRPAPVRPSPPSRRTSTSPSPSTSPSTSTSTLRVVPRLAALGAFLALGAPALVARPGPATAAARAPDPRELEAREAFAAARYREALGLFAKLYAETLHPNYLRNIGRCYQNLGEPDQAISSFRDYLRKAKRLGTAERAEIDGYIAEMEALREARQAAAPRAVHPSPPPAAAPPVTALAPAPAAAPSGPLGRPTATAAPDPALVVQAPPPPAAAPFYRRWWFWTALGVAALGAVGVVAAGARREDRDLCADGRICQ